MIIEDDEFILHGPEPLEPVSENTLGIEIYQKLLENVPLGDVMVDAFTGRTLSYKTLLEEACQVAKALRFFGYKVGDVISISSENCLEFFIPVIASLFVGCIVAPINHNYTEYEMRHNLNIGKPKAIFCSKMVSSKFLELKKSLGYIKQIIIIDSDPVPETENLESFVKAALNGRSESVYEFKPYAGNSEKLGAFIMCSSGTTGLPKGVLLSHRNVMVRIQQSRDPKFSLSSKNILGLLPFFHAYCLNICLNNFVNGQTTIALRKFEEDIFLKSIQDYKIGTLLLAPPLAIFLQKSPKVLNYDLSSVEEIVCGAAPLSKNTEFVLQQRLKNLQFFRQGYGLTEATLAVAYAARGEERAGSSGRIMSYMTCKLRDPDTGKSLGPNKVGEICVKGPLIMMGYYDNEKATKETFTPDGWLKTGDLAYYDKDGYFYIVDRLKELIKYKGYQVAPAELEAILLKHPKVRDVGVVGLPDELCGELPVAFVTKVQGEEVTEEELQIYVARLVSPQKHLRGGVIFISEIPKNPSGKILRRQLREILKNYTAKTESKL